MKPKPIGNLDPIGFTEGSPMLEQEKQIRTAREKPRRTPSWCTVPSRRMAEMLIQHGRCGSRMFLTDDAPQDHGSTDGGEHHGGNSGAFHHNAAPILPHKVMFSAWLMRKLRLRVLRYTMPRRQDKIPANHRRHIGNRASIR